MEEFKIILEWYQKTLDASDTSWRPSVTSCHRRIRDRWVTLHIFTWMNNLSSYHYLVCMKIDCDRLNHSWHTKVSMRLPYCWLDCKIAKYFMTDLDFESFLHFRMTTASPPSFSMQRHRQPSGRDGGRSQSQQWRCWMTSRRKTCSSRSHARNLRRCLWSCYKGIHLSMLCCCDGQVLYTQACDSSWPTRQAVLGDYVFELDNPHAFSQFLGLLQQKVVGDPYIGHRGLWL